MKLSCAATLTSGTRNSLAIVYLLLLILVDLTQSSATSPASQHQAAATCQVSGQAQAQDLVAAAQAAGQEIHGLGAGGNRPLDRAPPQQNQGREPAGQPAGEDQGGPGPQHAPGAPGWDSWLACLNAWARAAGQAPASGPWWHDCQWQACHRSRRGWQGMSAMML